MRTNPEYRKLPKRVNGFPDRTGMMRYYFRLPGERSIPLPGEPSSPEFMAAYLAALGQKAARKEARIVSGTIGPLVGAYYTSRQFLALAENTRRSRRSYLERFRANHGNDRVAMLTSEHVTTIVEKLSPPVRKGYILALHELMKFAIEKKLRKDDPTDSVIRVAVKSEAIHNWTDDEIAQYKARYPLGRKERLAMLLLLCTAQRRSDVVKMGREHVIEGMIWVPQQEKTGSEVWIPIHEELAEAIAATKTIGIKTFLVSERGTPFDVGSFGNSFRKWCNAAGLPQCSAHGLRHAGLTWLADMGCSASEIMAISGHLSMAQAEHYVRKANRKKLSISAMAKIAGTRLGERT